MTEPGSDHKGPQTQVMRPRLVSVFEWTYSVFHVLWGNTEHNIYSLKCIFIYSQQWEEEQHILTSEKLEPVTCLTFLPQERLINIRIVGNSFSFDRLSAAALHSFQNSQISGQHQPSDTNRLFTISRHSQSKLCCSEITSCTVHTAVSRQVTEGS